MKKTRRSLLITFSIILLVLGIFLSTFPFENSTTKSFKTRIINSFENSTEAKPLSEFLDTDTKAVCFLRSESYSKKFARDKYEPNGFTTAEKLNNSLPENGYAIYIGQVKKNGDIDFISVRANEFQISGKKFSLRHDLQLGGVPYGCMSIDGLFIQPTLKGKNVDAIGKPLLLITKG